MRVQERTSAFAPGRTDGLLVDLMPFGQLVVREHRFAEAAEAGEPPVTAMPTVTATPTATATLTGEDVSLALRQVAGSATLEGAGHRSLVCAWLAGPAFDPAMEVEVSASIVARADLAAHGTGDAAASCALDCHLLGTAHSFTMTLGPQEIQATSPTGSWSSRRTAQGASEARRRREQVFTVVAHDILSAGRLETRPFTTQASASAALAGEGEVSVRLDCAWTFAARVSDVAEAKPAEDAGG